MLFYHLLKICTFFGQISERFLKATGWVLCQQFKNPENPCKKLSVLNLSKSFAVSKIELCPPVHVLNVYCLMSKEVIEETC